jgi:hypothetical protein
LGAGSGFDGGGYGTTDVGLAAALFSDDFELYVVPAIGLGFTFKGPSDITTLYTGGLLGGMASLTPRLSIGVEGVVAWVRVFNSTLDSTWGAGAGLFARYLFGDRQEARERTPPD